MKVPNEDVSYPEKFRDAGQSSACGASHRLRIIDCYVKIRRWRKQGLQVAFQLLVRSDDVLPPLHGIR